MRITWVSIIAIASLLGSIGLKAANSAELPVVLVLSEALESDLRSRAVIQALRVGMADKGLLESETVKLEIFYNWDPGAIEKKLAALEEGDVDVIVTQSPMATAQAMAFTKTIPIVVGANVDLLASGFVASLGRPAGNVTGLSTQTEELWEKRLSLLAEIVPELDSVAVLGSVETPTEQARLDRAVEVVSNTGRSASKFGIAKSRQIWPSIKKIAEESADGVLLLDDAVMIGRQRSVVAWHAQSGKLATVASDRAYAEDGALLSYGISVPALQRRVASYVQRLLAGADPQSLPIEQPTELELVINKKTADYLGLTVPLPLMLLADDVIE